MARFLAIPIENGRTLYLNVDAIRVVNDHPDEDGVRIDFDDQHRVYLDRTRAKSLLDQLGSN